MDLYSLTPSSDLYGQSQYTGYTVDPIQYLLSQIPKQEAPNTIKAVASSLSSSQDAVSNEIKSKYNLFKQSETQGSGFRSVGPMPRLVGMANPQVMPRNYQMGLRLPKQKQKTFTFSR